MDLACHGVYEVMDIDTDPAITVSKADFEACVAVRYPRLLARLNLMVRDPEEARDLAQVTLTRAWQAWDTIRRDDLGGWLEVVGSRLALNEIRRRRRHPWSRLDGHEVPSETTVDPDLWEALGALRREERVALVLNVLGGYTHAEIGEQLGVPGGTVASWLSRGKQHLRDRLRTKE